MMSVAHTIRRLEMGSREIFECPICGDLMLNDDCSHHDCNKGKKYDTGKRRMDLIPPSAINALAEVLTYGAEKYEANNWQGVAPERYFAACMRHLWDYWAGSDKDEESGIHHLKHALTNIAFMVHFEEEKND